MSYLCLDEGEKKRGDTQPAVMLNILRFCVIPVETGIQVLQRITNRLDSVSPAQPRRDVRDG